MDAKRKKIERIYMIVTIVIILAIIGVVVYFLVTGGIKDVDENINLEDNSFIEGKQEECEYTIWLIQLNKKAYGAKVKFYGYDSEYITVKIGSNYDREYKNTIKSVLIKDVEKASSEEIEKKIDEYREKVMGFLNYDEISKQIVEFDRNKDIEKDADATKSPYENLKSGETIHYITLFEERLNYELCFYEENNVLYAEVSYYIPSTYESEPDPNIDPNDIPRIEGVG